MRKKSTLFLMSMFIMGALFAQTYDNGPLATGTTAKNGTVAPSSTQWSELQNDAGVTTIANVVRGFAGYKSNVNGVALDFGLADDFTVPAGETWSLTSLDVFAYQSSYAGLTSPFTQMYIRIWDGPPGGEGSNIIAGDLTTNVLTGSVLAGLYRISNTIIPPTPTTLLRRIWTTTGTITKQLTAGTYWIEWQFPMPDNQAAFFPSVTIVDKRFLPGMNAKVRIGTSTWINVLDSSTTPIPANIVPQDMPFILHYIKTLSVTFLNFDGAITNNHAALKWSTATEINNKGFNVERSIDGQNFSSIGFVEGHGSSNVVNNYSFDDNKLLSGTLYYRLKQIDLDGKFTYSKTIQLNQDNKFSWNIYPNPVTDNSWLQIQLATASKVTMQMVAVNGKILQAVDKGTLAPGTYSLPLNLKSVAKGTYFIKLMIGDKTYSQTIVK